MITRRFIEKIRSYFDELSIDAKNGILLDEFKIKFIKTLNRCKELDDAKLAIIIYKYCLKKWNKIEKIFTKYLDKWHDYNFEDASNIETVNDQSASGVYLITNTLTEPKEIFFTSKSFDDELYSFKYKNNVFKIEDDSYFYLKYSKTQPGTIKLFNNKDNLLCNIILSDTYDIFLEKNNTDYELIIKNENDDESPFIGVFKKSYIDNLGDSEFIEFKNMIADIEWDLLDSKSDVGIARINLYQEIDDISILLYFASSTFLLYKSYNDAEKSKNLTKMIALNTIAMRNLR